MLNANPSEALLTTLGLLHFLQLPCTSILARGTLKLTRELRLLSPVNQRVVLIFVGAVAFMLMGLGALIVWRSHAFATSALGHWLCVFLATFWSTRALAQLWLWQVWPEGRQARAWYWGLLSLYFGLAGGYWLVTGASGL